MTHRRSKSNLLAKFFGRKPARTPAPQPSIMKEISMADKKTLFAIIKSLIDAYVAAKMKIDSLENEKLSMAARIRDLEGNAEINNGLIAGYQAQIAADAAQDAEMENAIKGILDGNQPDTGGSTGGVVG